MKGKQDIYTIRIDRTETSFGARVDELPGCVAVAESREEVIRLINEAVSLHEELLVRGEQPGLLVEEDEA